MNPLDVKHYEYEKFLFILFWSLQDYLQVVPCIKMITHTDSFFCIVALSTTFLQKGKKPAMCKTTTSSNKHLITTWQRWTTFSLYVSI